MAELADAHGSGPCESNFMEVQVREPFLRNIGYVMQITKIKYAPVAELADAHGSGPCESDFMGVQISPGAP